MALAASSKSFTYLMIFLSHLAAALATTLVVSNGELRYPMESHGPECDLPLSNKTCSDYFDRLFSCYSQSEPFSKACIRSFGQPSEVCCRNFREPMDQIPHTSCVQAGCRVGPHIDSIDHEICHLIDSIDHHSSSRVRVGELVFVRVLANGFCPQIDLIDHHSSS